MLTIMGTVARRVSRPAMSSRPQAISNTASV